MVINIMQRIAVAYMTEIFLRCDKFQRCVKERPFGNLIFNSTYMYAVSLFFWVQFSTFLLANGPIFFVANHHLVFKMSNILNNSL